MRSGVIVLVGPFINNQSPYKKQHPTGMVEASTLTFVIYQWESAYEELRMRGLWGLGSIALAGTVTLD
jgi:hypothetical protein